MSSDRAGRWRGGALACLVILMLGACTDRSQSPIVPEALSVGTNVPIFTATTRAREPDGSFGFRRSDEVTLLETIISIPPAHETGDLKFGYGNPDPRTEFTVAAETAFADIDAFAGQLRRTMAADPARLREVTVFVHGYNATQVETAYRAAQLTHDLNLPGETLIYSWPSRGRPLGYVYDHDSMLFARDGLERVLRQLSGIGIDRIVIVAHSMGSALAMETLRQIEIDDPGWAVRSGVNVVLISPDIDVEVFRKQFERLERPPDPFIVFVSDADPALSLSGRLRGGQKRLGNIDNIDRVRHLPIEIVDTSAFATDAESSHLVVGTSPTLIAMFNGMRAMNQTFADEASPLELLFSGDRAGEPGARQITLLPAEEQPR